MPFRFRCCCLVPNIYRAWDDSTSLTKAKSLCSLSVFIESNAVPVKSPTSSLSQDKLNNALCHIKTVDVLAQGEAKDS